ncbi:MAG TPA: zinc ABC transporter substrate-binding protein [Gemmatimonadaceae bacterium]|nr:zinc ABC transporter substrate-binding protein [Gemmatimonadaceae bacterium]
MRSTISLLLVPVVLACGVSEGRDLGDRRLRVVATTSIIADVAREVGGERVQVIGLMGPGIDPHLYKASEGDVQRLAGADIVLYNGLHLEAKMADVLERMQGRVRTVALGEAVPRERLLAPPEFGGAYDPHVWHAPELWRHAVERARDALVAADTAGAAVFHENAARYLARLDSLHAWATAEVGRVPAEMRVLVTAHDAFNYFGRAYGIEVRGLQGISTATEAGTADVRELAEFIASRRIPAVFVESSIPRRTIEAVQAAVRARGHRAEIGGELFSDALGNHGTPEGTYVGMIRHNVTTIVRALRGELAA